MPLRAQLGAAQGVSPSPASAAAEAPQGMTTGAITGAASASLPGTAASASPVTIHSDDLARQSSGSATNDPTERAAPDQLAAGARSSAGTPLVPARLSDFEVFVRDTIGYALPVFGRGLFVGSNAAFQAESATAPADYVIGPGDELRVRSTGKVDLDVRTRVDAGGQIFIPQVGPITVAGTHADQLSDVVRRAVGRQFKGFELTVTLGQLRSIQIFILGQARRPGTYTVSALSSLVNALFASGGPAESGSLRDIQLIRNNETIAHFDMYRLLLSGDKSADRTLLAGDILYIPPVGPQVAVAGDVSNPAIYELHGSTTVDDVVRDAAGLTPIAGTGRATLDRIQNHERRSVLNFPLDAAGRSTVLTAGDILRILPVSPQIDDAVTMRGPVGMPGRYAWRPGMRVSDLIPTRLSLLTRDYYNRRNALDLSGAPVAAADGGEAGRQARTLAQGDGRFSLAPDTAGDERITPPTAARHETDVNWNYATIERLDPADLKTHLIAFNLGHAIDQPASADNKALVAGDVLVLYSSTDIQLPLELTTKFVRIDGEVIAPGVYEVSGTETLRDLVRKAGGLAPHAYLYAAQFTRESVRTEQEEKLQRLLQRERTQAFSPSNVITAPNSTGGGVATSSAELELRRAYLAELATLHATGRVVLALTPESRSVDDLPNLLLQDADHLFVPSLPSTVSVLGTVYNPGALLYVDRGRVKRYLNAAGGAEREADPAREFIVRADGSLVGRANVSGFDRQIIYPGDAIVVPANFKGRRASLNFVDLSTALGSLALTAVAVKALN